MRVAILSDVHDNLKALRRALEALRREADALIFCGDFCAPFTLKEMAEGFPGPIHAIFGNNDGDPLLMARIAAAHPHVTLHGIFAEVELGGRAFAVVHYPELARPLARSGLYDVVCYGHDHTPAVERVGTTWKVNPGELYGRFGPPRYAIFDTEAEEVRSFEVKG